MLKRTIQWCAIVAIACSLLPGCAYFSKNGRRQMAYARYVKKYSGRRAKAQVKYKKVKMPRQPPPSDFRTNTEVTGPQSVTSGQADPPPQ
jgi:hypothetical protein